MILDKDNHFNWFKEQNRSLKTVKGTQPSQQDQIRWAEDLVNHYERVLNSAKNRVNRLKGTK